MTARLDRPDAGSQRGRTVARPDPLTALAATVIVYVLGVFIIPALPPLRSLTAAVPWLSSGTITQTVLLLSSLLLMRFLGRRPLRDYGFRSTGWRQLLAPVGAAVGIALAGLVLFSVLTMLAGASGPGPGMHPAARQGFVHTVLTVWIYASLCEEMLYRGWLQTCLSPWRGERGGTALSPAVLIPALIFSLGHLCLLGSIGTLMLVSILLMTFAIGWVAGYHRAKTQSLLPAFLAHLTANVVGSGVPLLMSRLMTGRPGMP